MSDNEAGTGGRDQRTLVIDLTSPPLVTSQEI